MESAVAVGQGAIGAVMLAAPGRAAGWSSGGGSAPPSWIVRLLGGRMAAQAALIGTVRAKRHKDLPAAMRLGAVVDLLHGTSMIAAAGFYPRYRRAALVSAGVAFAAGAAEWKAAR